MPVLRNFMPRRHDDVAIPVDTEGNRRRGFRTVAPADARCRHQLFRPDEPPPVELDCGLVFMTRGRVPSQKNLEGGGGLLQRAVAGIQGRDQADGRRWAELQRPPL